MVESVCELSYLRDSIGFKGGHSSRIARRGTSLVELSYLRDSIGFKGGTARQ